MVELTAEIVGAHVSFNTVGVGELGGLITSVHGALSRLGDGLAVEAPVSQKPAVSVRASVKAEYLVCLEDGRKLKMLKRYLSTHYGMTPGEYREKWGLPKDYPMVAPAYAEKRRALALSIGLGKGGRGRPPAKKRQASGKK